MSSEISKLAENAYGYLNAAHWGYFSRLCFLAPRKGGWFSVPVNGLAAKFRTDRKTVRRNLEFLARHSLIEIQVRGGRTRANRLKINTDYLRELPRIPVWEFDETGAECPPLEETGAKCPPLVKNRGKMPQKEGQNAPTSIQRQSSQKRARARGQNPTLSKVATPMERAAMRLSEGKTARHPITGKTIRPADEWPPEIQAAMVALLAEADGEPDNS